MSPPLLHPVYLVCFICFVLLFPLASVLEDPGVSGLGDGGIFGGTTRSSRPEDPHVSRSVQKKVSGSRPSHAHLAGGVAV